MYNVNFSPTLQVHHWDMRSARTFLQFYFDHLIICLFLLRFHLNYYWILTNLCPVVEEVSQDRRLYRTTIELTDFTWPVSTDAGSSFTEQETF
jgi:hypothetical protein